MQIPENPNSTSKSEQISKTLEVSERINFEWPEIERDCVGLAEQLAYSKIILLGVGTGSWITAKLIKAVLTKHKKDVTLTVIGVAYDDLGTDKEEVKLYQDFSPSMIEKFKKMVTEEGYQIVVFDTLMNTGRTIKFATEYLKSVGLEGCKVATLHWEVQPRKNVPEWRKFIDIIPDYFSQKVITKSENPYLGYPWDRLEK